MKRTIVLCRNIFAIFLATFLGALSLYLQLAVVLSLIPINRNYLKQDTDVTIIYLRSNGVHLDLIIPFSNTLKDWKENLTPDVRIIEQIQYVGIGWGNREFYLNTPEWCDLKFSTAFNALFLNQPSALHISYYRLMEEGQDCKKIHITRDQYCRLVEYIESAFITDSMGSFVRITGISYEVFDQFFEARGSYSLFFTCNTWTNNALRNSGLRACLWTPFDRGILIQYWRNN